MRAIAEKARDHAQAIQAATEVLIRSDLAPAFADADLKPTLKDITEAADNTHAAPACLASRCSWQAARALTLLAEARETPEPPSFDEFRAAVLLLGRSLASLINELPMEPAERRAAIISWAKAVNTLTKGILVVGAPMIGDAFNRLTMESAAANGSPPAKVSCIHNWWVINERGITQTKAKVS